MRHAQAKLAVVAAVTLLACGGSEPRERAALPTWEEFRQAAYQEPDTGVWITNGDELAETEALLAEAYQRFAAQEARGDVAQASAPLIVNRVRGSDDRWPAELAVNLTYCVDLRSFGGRYTAVVNAMASAASAWEGPANVDFVHDASQDGNCTSRNTNVVFNVRQVNSSRYLARAFFPSSSRRAREVLVSVYTFGNIAPWSVAGVLRHELGHALGFRHEHTRPEAGTCFEDTSWRALTAYDSRSVMHYPQCNGDNAGDLVLTNLDQQGAASLYP